MVSPIFSAVYQSDLDALQRQRSFDMIFLLSFFKVPPKNIFDNALHMFLEDFLSTAACAERK